MKKAPFLFTHFSLSLYLVFVIFFSHTNARINADVDMFEICSVCSVRAQQSDQGVIHPVINYLMNAFICIHKMHKLQKRATTTTTKNAFNTKCLLLYKHN